MKSKKTNIINPLRLFNASVFLQQQRYMVPVCYLFYQQNGLGLSEFILFQSFFYMTVLLTQIPAGYIGDVFPRKTMMIISYFFFIARIVLWMFFRGFWVVLAGEILLGLYKSFFRSVSDGYMYDYLKENDISSKMLLKYGKLNFFISFGSALGALFGAYLYQFWGFFPTLLLELILNSIALVLLAMLPNVKQEKPKYNFIEHVKKMFSTVKKAVCNNNINSYMFYSAILMGITSVFVWNFQPTMEKMLLPVMFFGGLYFINHFLRAVFSLYSDKIIKKFTLPKVATSLYFLYIVGLFMMVAALKAPSNWICFSVLAFVCVIIGLELAFNIATTSRLHTFIPSATRSTVSSVNNMFWCLFPTIFLMLFKFLLDYISIEKTYIVFAGIFMLSFVLLRRIKKLSV